MLTEIKFGTSGRRPAMAEEFTFANVRRALAGARTRSRAKGRDGAENRVPDSPFAITPRKKTEF
jgi:phosphomannomutase